MKFKKHVYDSWHDNGTVIVLYEVKVLKRKNNQMMYKTDDDYDEGNSNDICTYNIENCFHFNIRFDGHTFNRNWILQLCRALHPNERNEIFR